MLRSEPHHQLLNGWPITRAAEDVRAARDLVSHDADPGLQLG